MLECLVEPVQNRLFQPRLFGLTEMTALFKFDKV